MKLEPGVHPDISVTPNFAPDGVAAAAPAAGERAGTSVPVLPQRLVLAAFVAAIFASATLLFAVQPMFTKMVLPQLGGAASVWSTAMVFFQAVLLAGYGYAHLLIRFAPNRASAFIHVAIMIVACTVLPLHIANGWGRAPPSGESLWLLTLFAASVGLPFFALSANGSLLQAWFARSGHPAAKDPYFLYAASNAGSLLALLSYPVVIEPFVGLRNQALLWTIGYVAEIVLVAACGTLVVRSGDGLRACADVGAESAAAPTWRVVLPCIGLAAVPSGLLLAVTAHISTDVAAVPLFWVVPLALYLLAFMIAFQTRPFVPHRLVVKAFPVFVVAQVVVMIIDPIGWIVPVICVDLGTFFVIALLCHGELARRRPAPRYLTNFYLWIATGGTIGGIATGLIAPHVFSWVAEYPLLIALAVLCLPRPPNAIGRRAQFAVISGLAIASLVLLGLNALEVKFPLAAIMLVEGGLLGLTVFVWQAPPAFAAIVGFVLFASNYGFYPAAYNTLIRNFFGVLWVVESADGRFRTLWHGTIGQGTQRIRDNAGNRLSGRPEPIAEFFNGAGIAQAVDAVRKRVGGPARYAVIGLGTGALACRAQPDDTVTYYELDPDVIRIARDPALFTYLSQCAPGVRIVQGDARLALADAPDGSYDMIFVDAFLGAAIPVHLLTHEAMALYFRKVNPHGVVAVHVSNRNLELASVVVGAAEANGAMTRVYLGGDVHDDPRESKWVPHVAVAARSEEDFGALAASRYWPLHRRDPSQGTWSDDYSDILGAMIRRLRERDRPVRPD